MVLEFCNECENWRIFICTWVTDVSRHVSYRTLEVRWLSAQQFDTFYRMVEQTFLHTLISLYNSAPEGKLSSVLRFKFAIYMGDRPGVCSAQKEEQNSYNYVYESYLASVCTR